MNLDPFRCRTMRRGALAGVALAAVAYCSGVVRASEHHEEVASEESADDTAEGAAGPKIRGAELGEFRIRAYYPVQAQKSTIRFVLYAAIQGERFSETRRLLEHRQHKIRDQVITATRLVPLVEFDEPDLASFRRRILLRLRRAVPELTIDDVYVSDFELTVQSL